MYRKYAGLHVSVYVSVLLTSLKMENFYILKTDLSALASKRLNTWFDQLKADMVFFSAENLDVKLTFQALVLHQSKRRTMRSIQNTSLKRACGMSWSHYPVQGTFF